MELIKNEWFSNILGQKKIISFSSWSVKKLRHEGFFIFYFRDFFYFAQNSL